jgi:hypothetical protein
VSADQAAALTDALRLLRADADVSARDGAVELTAARAALRQAILVAVDEAGERLGGLCTALLRGEAPAADVRAQHEALGALLELV